MVSNVLYQIVQMGPARQGTLYTYPNFHTHQHARSPYQTIPTPRSKIQMGATKRPNEKNGRDSNSSKKKIKLDYKNLKPSHTLYAKNLNNSINKRLFYHNLYLLFSAFGDVISIQLHKGYAFIVFAQVDSATLALRSLQDEKFFDKPLVINFAVHESKVILKATDQGKASEYENEQEKDADADDDDEVLPSYE
ncbi:uncharacterized protein LODBEIA_P07190 [Lodderomyces beijingensis]|uniref:RRM domain-containing protein n=1 Tax=Lodderomyces beijingensis TaxID=1775926 RepID=A0ABP0ZJM2_9ASCO